jgi:hypothetical protein
MLKGLLSAETVARELPDDATVLVVVARGTDSVVAVPDKITGQGVVLTFMKQEDAEHFSRLLQSETPAFKNTELDIVSVLLTDVINQAIKDKQMIGVVTPNSAMEFFKEFQDLLPDYYK